MKFDAQLKKNHLRDKKAACEKLTIIATFNRSLEISFKRYKLNNEKAAFLINSRKDKTKINCTSRS